MKYLLFNHSGSSNHGCEAIVRGTEKIVIHADENAEFALMSTAPETDKFDEFKIFAPEHKKLNICGKAIAKAELVLKKNENYSLKKSVAPMLGQAEEYDFCLSVGGDTYCYGDNHEVQIFTEELKRKNKKVVLWGASLGEEDLDERKKENLKYFDAIFTRESLTYDLLTTLKSNEKIYCFPDPAFCMEKVKTQTLDGDYVGINISPLVCEKNERITQITENFIAYLTEKTPYKILLIPHVIENGNNDYEYMYGFYEKFKDKNRISILPDNLNAMQYKGYISQMKFFIGARTHATIAAYSSGVPTVVLGYSVKSRGIAKDIFGEEKYVLDSQSLTTSDELTEQFELLQKDEEKIKKILNEKIPVFKSNAMKMGSELIKL